MTREDYLTEFIECMRELLDLGFNLEKNNACSIITSTFELMRYSGCVDDTMKSEELYEIIFKGKESGKPTAIV